MPDPIPDTDAFPPTAGELAMADTALDLAIRSGLAADTDDGPVRLTMAGLHALAALAAMLDAVADELIAAGIGTALLGGMTDTPSRAFTIVHLLDDRPDWAASLLAR